MSVKAVSGPQGRSRPRTASGTRKKKAKSASPTRRYNGKNNPRSGSRRGGGSGGGGRSPSRRPSSPLRSPKRGRSPSRRRRSSSGYINSYSSSPQKFNTTLGGTMTYQAKQSRTKSSTMHTGKNGEDSVAFCRKVKHTFRHRPNTYRQFVKIMAQIRDDRSDKVDIIKRVILLFDGYPNLVREFNQFLPIDYTIEMQGDMVLVKVYDEADEDTIGLVETGTLATLGQNGTMTYGPGSSRSMGTLGGRVTTAKYEESSNSSNMGESMGATQFGTATLGPNKDATVEYIKKVKQAFSDKPKVYRRFMEALREYHKDEADVLVTVKRVVSLFQNHTDLVLGFNEFLPKHYKIRMFDRRGYTVQHPSAEQGDRLDSFQIMIDDRFA